MISIILILKSLGLGYLVSRFSPIKSLLNFIGLLIKKRNPKVWHILLFEMVEEILTCFKCLSFWIGLIMTGSIWIGIISFILAFIYQKKYSDWENKIIIK